jgi:hypothetical protein
MKRAAIKSSRRTRRASRGLIEKTLLKIARANGYQVTRVSPTAMAKAKGESRRRDDELIRTGKATPEEIQAKNDFFPGKVEVLDWSPIFA